MPTPLNLTGAWVADDGAIYYIRHSDDNSIWWAGLHNSGFHLGLEFTNVFHGVVNVGNKTIEGSWADVPRGQNVMRQGHLSLDIVETASLLDKASRPHHRNRTERRDPGLVRAVASSSGAGLKARLAGSGAASGARGFPRIRLIFGAATLGCTDTINYFLKIMRHLETSLLSLVSLAALQITE